MINFVNNQGIPIIATSQSKYFVYNLSNATLVTLNLAGKSIGIVGSIMLEGGSGSKTISSAGGKIFLGRYVSGAFSNAGTNMRIGIQDIDVNGIEDGTFDVYRNVVGGSGELASNAILSFAMNNGSKTITHGDQVAVVIEMITRGGTDGPIFGGVNFYESAYPYITIDSTGGGSSKAFNASMMAIGIQFDDGTVGWIDGGITGMQFGAVPIESDGFPSEYGLLFTLPFGCDVTDILIGATGLSSSALYDTVLYSDPLGSAVVVYNNSATNFNHQSYNDGFSTTRVTGLSLLSNIQYALVVKPRSGFTTLLQKKEFNNANLKKGTLLGMNWSACSRSGYSGPFTEITTQLPAIGFMANNITDPAGSGGGVSGGNFPFG